MISATILTKNSAATIRKTLESTRFLDEVLILDTGSTDETLAIAKEFPHVKILTHDFIGFGPLHNFAAHAAKNDWIFSLDSDEVISAPLREEIEALTLKPTTVYSIPFQNYFEGKLIKWCGWYPDRHLRLYNRLHAEFSEALIHEKLVAQEISPLNCPIQHYSYRSISDFLVKMERYSTLFANQYRGRRRATLFTAIYHGLFAFFKSYFLKRGILGGAQGYIISCYNAHTAYYKYLKLREANQRNAPSSHVS